MGEQLFIVLSCQEGFGDELIIIQIVGGKQKKRIDQCSLDEALKQLNVEESKNPEN